MPNALNKQLRKELAELRSMLAVRADDAGVVLLFQDRDTDPTDLQRRIDEASGRHVLVLEFIGPEGGAEEGTGPQDPAAQAAPPEDETEHEPI